MRLWWWLHDSEHLLRCISLYPFTGGTLLHKLLGITIVRNSLLIWASQSVKSKAELETQRLRFLLSSTISDSGASWRRESFPHPSLLWRHIYLLIACNSRVIDLYWLPSLTSHTSHNSAFFSFYLELWVASVWEWVFVQIWELKIILY